MLNAEGPRPLGGEESSGLREVLLTHPDGYSVLVIEIGCWDEFLNTVAEAFSRLGPREFMAAAALNGVWGKKERKCRDIGLVLMGMINRADEELKEDLKAALRAERLHDYLLKRAKEAVDKGADKEVLKVPQWVCGTPLSRVIAAITAACYFNWLEKKVDSVTIVFKEEISEDFAKRVYSATKSLLEFFDGRRFKWCRVLKMADDPTSLTPVVRADMDRVPKWDKATQLVATAYDKRWFKGEDEVKAYAKNVGPVELSSRIAKFLVFASKKVTKKLAKRMDVPVPTAWIKLCRHSLWRTIKVVGELAEVTPVTAASWLSRIVDDEKWERDWNYFDHSVAYRIGLRAIERVADGERVDSAIKAAIKEELGEDKLKRRVRGRHARFGLNVIYAKVLEKAAKWTSFFPWKKKWWREKIRASDLRELRNRLKIIRRLAEAISKAVEKLERRVGEEGREVPIGTDGAVIAVVLTIAAAYEWEETDIREVAEDLLWKIARATSYTEEEAERKVEKLMKMVKEMADRSLKVMSAAAGVVEIDDEQLERRIEEREPLLPGAMKSFAKGVRSFLRRFLGLADPDEASIDEVIEIPQLVMLIEASTGPPPNW